MAASREPRSAADSNWRGASPACAACSFATFVAKLDISRVSLGRLKQHQWLQNQLQLADMLVNTEFARERRVDGQVQQHISVARWLCIVGARHPVFDPQHPDVRILPHRLPEINQQDS
jgi:hypothetical protein